MHAVLGNNLCNISGATYGIKNQPRDTFGNKEKIKEKRDWIPLSHVDETLSPSLHGEGMWMRNTAHAYIEKDFFPSVYVSQASLFVSRIFAIKYASHVSLFPLLFSSAFMCKR